jgi:cation diffusion facilitator CzcD-associated flavoprotein CzcO
MSARSDIESSLGFDPTELRQRYSEERDKRLRPEGKRQYRAASREYPQMLEDPFNSQPAARTPVKEEVDALVVGGGMSGLMTAASLLKAGVESVRLLEAGADFGGTWYWNRYPGAQCDTEAYIYMPWLEETGYVPTEKYARGPELFSYFQRFGRHFGLYEKTFFKTKAQEARWDEARRRWVVLTDRGDTILARFISFSTGSLAQPKLPGVPGTETFKGRAFLTSRWDYDYTGGSPENPQLTKLRNKRVAIIGTGCTAVQAVPFLAEWAEHLFLFQRTPSMINIRANKRTDDNWAQGLKPGWQEERTRNFEICVMDPAKADVDLVNDGWTDLARKLMAVDRVRELVGDADAAVPDLMQLADFIAMEENRARVAEHVKDLSAAASLKPYYNVHCKRPAFHDEFLDVFNRDNVTLVDTGGSGVERITEKGIVVGGKAYDVDCIIFATGFEALSMCYRSGEFSVFGVDGQSLEEKWSRPFRSLHGVFSHDFPNMAVVGQIRDGAGSFNATYPFSLQARHVGEVFGRCVREHVDRFEVTKDAEEDWARVMREKLPPLGEFLAECTPGYLNNEGNVDEPALRTALYGGGTIEYGDILRAWRDGEFRRDIAQS